MFELEKFFGGLVKGSDKNGEPKKSIFSDSLKVSLFIAAVVILIIYLVFKNIVDEDDFIANVFKAGLFIIIAIVSGVFLHSKHLEHIYDKKYSDKSSEETVHRSTDKTDSDVSVLEISETPRKPGTSETPGVRGKGESSTAVNDKPVQVNVNISHLPDSGAFKPPKDA